MGQLIEDIPQAANWIKIDLAAKGYRLDFSAASLAEVDRFFSTNSARGKPVAGSHLSEDNLAGSIFALGCYVGEVIRREKGGTWAVPAAASSDVASDPASDTEDETAIELRLPESIVCWPVQRVMKRFQAGPDESLVAYGLGMGLSSAPPQVASVPKGEAKPGPLRPFGAAPKAAYRPPFLSGRALGWCLGGLLTALMLDGVLKTMLVDRAAWSWDSAALLMAGVSLVLLIVAGALAGRRARKLCLFEAVLTALAAAALAELPVLLTFLADQPWALAVDVQVYVIDAAVVAVGVGLATFVGTSMGYMLAGGGALDLGFGYELFVALTFLKLNGRGKSGRLSPSAVVTGIAILAVVIGMMALTVVLSVMSGFEQDLKHKILGTNAHAIVLRYGNDFRDYDDVEKKVSKVRGVIGVTPFTLNEVMVSSDNNLSGVVLKGIDPATIATVTDLAKEVTEGDLSWLTHPNLIPLQPDPEAEAGALSDRLDKLIAEQKALKKGTDKDAPVAPSAVPKPSQATIAPKAKPAEVNTLPGIVLGRELAKSLRIFVGDKVNVVSPLSNELGPTGPIPKSRPFRVAAIFFSGMYEYDAKFAYLALPESQKFFGNEGSITGLELKVDDLDATRRITRDILFALDGYPYHTKDWGEMNKNLFAALAMEKLVMAIILGFASLPVGFLILAILMFLAFEKSKEIAVLKSMGARDQSIMKVFVLEGLIIGGVGAVLGLLVGLAICMFIAHGGIKLDPSVYYIETLPVRIESWQFGVVGLSALLLSYLATMYPAVAASRLAPVEGLRND